MLKTPYFGRFDFVEEGFDDKEKIYIGIHNLIDNEKNSVIVHDWRAPISSMYYQYEIGNSSYSSPVGTISGEILMKRQYKIEKSELKYFFDSSITIKDEMLQEVLSHNASSKMKNIVETIQKEQDVIIRDRENELLIVQGVAGSGKTSIALHRIAYLLYIGMGSKLSSNNIIIISPNSIFNKYISGVLPELGEENVKQTTFDTLVKNVLDSPLKIETREKQLEQLIISNKNYEFRNEAIKFKGSNEFVKIVQRFLSYYEKKLIPFKDVYFDGKIIETSQKIKNLFLNNKIDMPMTKRLKRIENMILHKIHPLKYKRLEKIEKIVQKSYGHELEIKSFSRLLSIKENKVFMEHLHNFTEISYMDLYKLLFRNKKLFLKLSEGLKLPVCTEEIMQYTKENLIRGKVCYEDCAPLMYIKLKIEGAIEFKDIKQVVIDEAQDYYPIQYEVFKILFGNARYTVLGDFNQTLERTGNDYIYDEIIKTLDKRKSVKLFLNKCYRSSFEISSFAQRFLDYKQDFVAFDRHEAGPQIESYENKTLLEKAICEAIEKYYKGGYESIAIICKTQKEVDEVSGRLKELVRVKLLNIEKDQVQKGVLVIPSYMAKGLEFDVVIVYNASKENYNSSFDKKLLYIACTRALHKLMINSCGEKSKFL